MNNWKRFSLIVVLTLTAALAHGEIIITEIMQNPAAVDDANGEWFEIFNSGASAVDLTGWTVADNGSNSFLIVGGSIGAGEYWVLGVNDDPTLNGNVAVDYVYDNFTLANGDDEVLIYDAGGALIDEVWYDGGPSFPDPTGASMQIMNPGTDNNVGGNWTESTTAWDGSAGDFGTPGGPYAALPEDMVNWSFEHPDYLLTGWYTSPTQADYTENIDLVEHGSVAMNVTLLSDTQTGVLVQQLDSPFGGASYRGSAYVVDGDQAGLARLVVTVADAGGNVILQDQGPASTDLPGGFQQLVLDFVMPVDAAIVEFGLEFEAEAAWDGDANFIVDAVNLAPTVDIAGIQLSDTFTGRRVYTTGLVTQGSNTVHGSYVDAYIQNDPSGDIPAYGVMLYDSDPLPDPLERGDWVEVFGTVDQYFDVTELVDFHADVTSSGNPMPAPKIFQVNNFGEAIQWEGIYAQVTGTLTTDPQTGSYNLEIGMDESPNHAVVRIWEDASLDLTGFAIGDNIRVRGTMDVYFGEAQLQPSEQEDIQGTPIAIPFDIAPSTGSIPPEGGTTAYNLYLINNTNQTFTGVRSWRSILGPNDVMYGPFQVNVFNMGPGFEFTQENITQQVPANAPEGIYVVFHHLGPSTNNSRVWDHYAFVKNGVVADGGELTNEDWLKAMDGAGELASDGTMSELPTEYAVGSAYPNPFNPATSLQVSLPEAAELTVTAFNVMGREVMQLQRGTVPAGRHAFTFDASQLSSGVYFLHVNVPGQLNELRKVTLMK